MLLFFHRLDFLLELIREAAKKDFGHEYRREVRSLGAAGVVEKVIHVEERMEVVPHKCIRSLKRTKLRSTWRAVCGMQKVLPDDNNVDSLLNISEM